MDTVQIKKGTRFHSVIADGNPEWEVTRSRGRGLWEAQCLGLDYKGTVRVFTEVQIRQAVGMQRAFEQLHREGDEFFARQAVGSTLHYDDGFDNYVRCEVVLHKGKKMLKPVALVGNWRKHDLPQRRADGTIYMGYHAAKIVQADGGEPWQPSVSCVYEANPAKYKLDPRLLPPLDLTVPPLDAAAAAIAAKWQKLQAIRALTEGQYGDPEEHLAKIREIVNAV